jgi:hypothetical protein
MYSKYIFRAQTAADAIFRSYAYERAAYEIAWLKAKRNKTDVRTEMNNLTPEEADIAARTAEVAVFGNENSINTAYQKWRGNRSSAIQFLLDTRFPFVKTGTNIFLRGLDYSGILPVLKGADALKGKNWTETKNELWSAINTPETRRAITYAASRGLVGWGLMIAGYQLGKAGYLYGYRDEKDKSENARETAEGATPGSIKIGGYWHDINSLSPVANFLIAGASWARDEAQAAAAEKKMDKISTASRVVLNFLTVAPLGRFGQDVFSGQQGFDLNKMLGVESIPGSFVPQIVAETTASLDSVARSTQAETFTERMMAQLKARIPGLREQLPARKDVFGQEVAQPLGMNPFNSRKAKDSKLLREMKETNFGFGVAKKPEESLEDLRTRQASVGANVQKMLEQVVESKYYSGSPKERKEILSSAATMARNDETKNLKPEEVSHNLDVIAWRESNKKKLEEILANGGFKDVKTEDRARYVANIVNRGLVNKTTKLKEAQREFERLLESPEDYMRKIYKNRKNRSKGDE